MVPLQVRRGGDRLPGRARSSSSASCSKAGAGGGAPNSTLLRAARANIRTHLLYIDHLIATKNWLAGDRMSYADLAAAAALSVADYHGRGAMAGSRRRKGLVHAAEVAPGLPSAARRDGARRPPAAALPGTRFLGPDRLRALVEALARAEGFDAIGVTTPDAIPEAAPRLRAAIEAGHHGTMDWLAETAPRRGSPRALWPDVRSVIMLGMNYGPDSDPLATLAERQAAHDLGLCPQPRLPRPDQGRAEADRVAIRRARRGRREGVRRHRAGHGEAACRSRRARLAGQAHQPRQPRVRLVALPRRDLHDGGTRAGRARRRIIAAAAAPASTSARPTPSRRPTGSMRGAASPTSPSSMTGRSRANSGRAIGNRIYGCDDCLAVCPWNKFAAEASQAKLKARADLRAPPLARACGGSTTRGSAACSPARRSSGSDATASCATC